jgi:hypothetical protein
MADAHTNFSYSTVATAPSPAISGTTLSFATGEGALMPTTPFNMTVWPAGVQALASNAEIIRVTNLVGDDVTMLREQEGSTARAILVGDQIAATITAKTLTDAEIGDVTGPSSAVNANIAVFDGVTGKIIADGGFNSGSFDANGSAGAVQSNLTTHQGLTASVHGFDASGNAPAQTHGMERHNAISHTALTDKGTNTHDQIDTVISDLATNTKTFYNIMSTGRKTGGVITITSGQPAKFDMTLGTGVVVNNYTDPNNPVFTNVSWPTRTSQTLTYLASADETALGIDSSGNIYQSNTPFSEDSWHDIIQIATIGHWSRTEINYIIMEPHGIISPMTQLQGFWNYFGPFNVSGNEFTANGANMKINKSGGDTFNQCAGAVKTPNIISSSAGTAVYFSYYYQSSPGVWVETALTQTIDDLKYDSGSGLSTVPVGKFTIQTIFLYAPLWVNGGSAEYSVDIQYGQVVYDTMALAQAAITSSVKFNDYLSYDTFRTWLIVKRGTTSLQTVADAKFIQAPPLKFGTMAATGGGSTGETNTASNIGTAGIGVFNSKVAADLQFKNIEAASSKLTVTDYPTNLTVRVDVAESNIVHQNVSGAGTNTHAQIDTHVASTGNPHSTSDANIVTSDITTNNTSITKHGFFPKLPNSGGTTFWADNGTWQSPGAASMPQVPLTNRYPSGDTTITANYIVFMGADHEIANGFVTEMLDNALLEVA